MSNTWLERKRDREGRKDTVKAITELPRNPPIPPVARLKSRAGRCSLRISGGATVEIKVRSDYFHSAEFPIT